ncbi:MAG: SdrD B-like domain-containing protein, partial [Umezawaea sp.]
MKRSLGAAVVSMLVCALVSTASTRALAEDPVNRADGTLTVRVVRDVTGSGSYQPALAIGVANAPITVTDAAGKTTSATTTADGTVSVGLDGLAGGKYRVDGLPPAGSKLQPAPAGAGLSPLTSFVDVGDGKDASLVLGLWNPADYCQENPTLVTGCQRNGIAPGVDNAARSVVSVPFTARGTAASTTQLASQGDTGTIYGLAYRKADKRVFSGAFAKRAALYGTGGQGAVYVTDTVANATTLFTTVPTAGSTAHAMETGADGAFADVVGKEALGDVDISEDGTTLYVVNLADRKLYLYDATAATAAQPKASYAIPDPGCPAAGDWRPGALGVRDGVVYVGGVCSGESTQQQADMKVVVRTFDEAAGTFGAPVVTQALTFKRGTTLWQGTPTDRWLPWQGKFTQPAPTGGLVENPEPLLTDIGIEANGDLVLGFRDRFGDQGGRSMPPADGSSGLFDTVSGGDLNRACRQADGTFAWEGTSGCANNNTGASKDPSEAGDVVEYFPGEYYSSDTDGAPHHETAQGAVATVYSATRMPATVMDPTGLNTGGIGWFDRTDGTMAAAGNPNGYQVSDTASEGWGKANGLADLEALCDQAPVQIGNRVWFDTDRDGIQDADEPAVAGVVVQLLACDGTGAPLSSATTDENGLYYFGKDQGLLPDTCYTLKFDYSGIDTSKLPGAPPLAILKWTTQNAGDNPQINSKVDPAGVAKVTTGGPGAVDHSRDAGISATPQNKLGDYVWVDANKNGIQDTGETPVPGVTVTLKDGSGNVIGSPVKTGTDGKYLFPELPDGSYQVCFDLKTLPAEYADYQPTKKDAAGHNGTDSAAGADGCTGVTTLGPTKRDDLTLDMGIAPPVNRLDLQRHDRSVQQRVIHLAHPAGSPH